MGKPVIQLRPVAPLPGTIATFQVWVMGVRSFDKVSIDLWETKFEGEKKEEEKLGTLQCIANSMSSYRFALIPQFNGIHGNVDPNDGKKTPRIALVLIQENGGRTFYFDVPFQPIDGKARESWFFQVKMTQPKAAESPKFPVGIIPWMLPVPSKASYDWHAHNKVHFYHGGSEGPPGAAGALSDIADAIGKAESFVFVADWSFHPYFRIDRGASDAKGTAGHLLVEAAKRAGVLVAIHAWKHASQVPDEQNNRMGARLEEIAGGALPKTLHWRCSERTGQRWSHHQKMVVCDVKGEDGRREVKAFFGGVDLTRGRFDWSDHVIAPDDPMAADFKKGIKRKRALNDNKHFPREYHDWYNGEFPSSDKEESGGQGKLDMPREPWHDIHGSIVGPAAWDMLREFVGRWNNDPNDSADGTGWTDDDEGDRFFVSSDVLAVNKRFVSLFDANKGDENGKKFVQQNEQPASLTDRPWAAQVYRSLDKEHWDKGSRILPSVIKEVKTGNRTEFEWKYEGGSEHSIQDAYLNAIGRAEEFIYIETQYFISSGKFWQNDSRGSIENTLAKAICDRIIEKKGDLHCYIVTPMYPEGDPGAGSVQGQRNLEWRTMQYMILRLAKEKPKMGGKDWRQCLSFYFPGRAAPPKMGQLVSSKDWSVHSGKIKGKPTRLVLRNGTPAPKFDTSWGGLAGGDDVSKLGRAELVQLNNRYYIYVHSKMMIVDDVWIIFGSANLNERSLNGGRDSEICIGMWPAYPGVREKCKTEIKTFREHLFQEHFGSGGSGDPKSIHGAVLEAAKQNYNAYRAGMPLPSGHAMTLPMYLNGDSLKVQEQKVVEWSNADLPDAPGDWVENDDGDEVWGENAVWRWDCDSTFLFNRAYLGPIVE